MKETIKKQIEFISELEKLKLVYRKNGILDGSRQENSAEHSWHVAIMALLLEDYASDQIDMLKLVKMLLVHDVVEIDAGDNWLYSKKEYEHIQRNEAEAAVRIFGLLPEKQRDEYLMLWREFEAQKTPEAQFAKVIDALHPLLNHLLTGKENYNPDNLTRSLIYSKKEFIKDISPKLWNITEEFIEKSVEKGLYEDDAWSEK